MKLPHRSGGSKSSKVTRVNWVKSGAVEDQLSLPSYLQPVPLVHLASYSYLVHSLAPASSHLWVAWSWVASSQGWRLSAQTSQLSLLIQPLPILLLAQQRKG